MIAKCDFAVRKSIILLCYILFAALSRSVKNTFILLFHCRLCRMYFFRFDFFKNKQDFQKEEKIYK